MKSMNPAASFASCASAVPAPVGGFRSRSVRSALLCVGLFLVQGLALAQISPESAETLLRKSGAWAQLADMSRHVKAGMAQSPMRMQLPPSEIARLERLSDEAFEAGSVRAAAMQRLSVKMDNAHTREALRWFDSPTGRMITAVEEASTVATTDLNATLEEGNRILAAAPEARKVLLSRAVKVSRMAEGMAAMQINTAVGIFQGLAAALPDQPMPPLDQLRAGLESQRATMVASMGGVGLALYANTYKSVSDKDLDLYVRFMASRAGSAYTLAMMEAIDHAMTTAFRTLGRNIPRSKTAPIGS